MLQRTQETGNEHGAVVCGDGSVSDIIAGGKTQMDITEAINQCPGSGPYRIVHTHPNGNPELSRLDRDAAMQDDVESVCTLTPSGVRCERIEACGVGT